MAAKSWECCECGVRASFSGDSAATRPPNWAKDEAGWHCLGCRREAAMDVPKEGDGTLSQRRRTNLLEFELLRDPAATDSQIARRAKCPTSRVPAAREALDKSGKRTA